MLPAILRYYYYSADDAEVIEKLVSEFQQHNIEVIIYDLSDKNKIHQNYPVAYKLSYARINIMVIKLNLTSSSWEKGLERLDTMEAKAGLDIDALLNKTTLLAGVNVDRDIAYRQVKFLTPGQQAVEINIKKGTLSLLNSAQERHLIYLCSLTEISLNSLNFLEHNFPLLLARLLNIQILSRFFKDRKKTILQEKQDVDNKLSNILHHHLVSERSRLKAAEELETQIQELSTSYGIIASDCSILMNAYNGC